jgi:hypothetical protein
MPQPSEAGVQVEVHRDSHGRPRRWLLKLRPPIDGMLFNAWGCRRWFGPTRIDVDQVIGELPEGRVYGVAIAVGTKRRRQRFGVSIPRQYAAELARAILAAAGDDPKP